MALVILNMYAEVLIEKSWDQPAKKVSRTDRPLEWYQAREPYSFFLPAQDQGMSKILKMWHTRIGKLLYPCTCQGARGNCRNRLHYFSLHVDLS